MSKVHALALPIVLAIGCGTATELAPNLRITEMDPTGGRGDLPSSTTFLVTFSEELVEDTVNDVSVQLLDESGEPVAGVVTYDVDTLAFDPDRPLRDDTDYTLVLEDTIEGTTSGGLGGTARIPFHTAAVEVPD